MINIIVFSIGAFVAFAFSYFYYNKIINSLNIKIAVLEQSQLSQSSDFENLATRIIENRGQIFNESILAPLREKLQVFEQKIDQKYSADQSGRSALSAEIQSLMSMSQNLGNEATNLAAALKGNNKQQGMWGEFVLERLLEMSGLRPNIDFSTQVTLLNNDNQRIQPDILVNLPNNRHIVIDSKVSLAYYLDYMNGGDIKAHINSIKTHIKNLSEKNYHTAQGISTPEFVIMFLPVESALIAALEHDENLFGFGWDKKIILASPSTLYPLLKTIGFLWKEQQQNLNALEIADEGGKMYDKFAAFCEDLSKIGKKISEANDSYLEASKKLSQGSGNLIRRAERMKELGVKNTKNLLNP